MAAGKTRVGTALSRFCGWPFIDIDLLVEGLERATVEEIFRRSGESYFRRLESTVLHDLCRGSGRIIGCGGGTVLSVENREALKRRCVTVWLKVSQPEILARLERPDSPRRPLLEGVDPREIVPALLRARQPFYAESEHAVETDGREVDEIAREIAVLLGLPATPGEMGGGP